MKKVTATLLAILLALTLVYALTACGSEPDGSSADTPGLPSAPDSPAPAPASEPAPGLTPAPGVNGAAAFPYKIEAADLFGNPVTAETLGEKEVYFIHLWATWCPPCVEEMPDFPELMRLYGDRVGFLALLLDYEDAQDVALEMVGQLGIPDSFYIVDGLAPGVSGLLDLLQSGYVPTTVLVSKDGAGEQIIGAVGLDGYSRHIDALLS